ncbi:NADPH:quinone oxidoreductase family protein [Roseibium sp. CAU 1637]|uniref:NADPH:quinone oxidoreductase family protein n=1 Tax=Roseibium limicola TaxID=2816037 RepID=A0A939JA61_9HYPH|nr:NADPH:quinone oxidoreductase family protein [Roseibium limicola]MBO0346614.1 NADPH:quinone oxidoreductase family protein [Roseibium limicola]
MKACICTTYGSGSDLTIQTLPDPTPGPGEVAVRVRAVSLNFSDTLLIAGKYQHRPEPPFSPGGEFSGIVEAVGDGVESVQPGDRVMGYMPFGAAREIVIAEEDSLIDLPPGLGFEVAAGLTVVYGTTLHALRDRGELVKGEKIAVLGATGGVGQAAVEIAILMGAEVIACASSPDKLEFAKALGAHHTIDYSTQDLKQTLKALTNGEGVDVVYDPIGGQYSEQALRATGWLGRYLVIGFAAGDIPRIPLNIVMLKGCDVRGVFWGESIVRDPDGHRENMEQILSWVEEGRLKPHIHATYPLEQIPAALQEISDRKARGKVILTM